MRSNSKVTCPTCGGCGSYVATQDLIADVRALNEIPDEVINALRDAAPMPAIVTCPVCNGEGEVSMEEEFA